MKEAYQEYAPAAAGFAYRRPPAVGPGISPLGPSLVYAAVGATLGILSVAMFAGQPWRAGDSMGLPDSVQVISRAVESTTPSVISPVQAQSITAPVAEKEAVAAAPAKSAVSSPAAHKSMAVYSQHSAGNVSLQLVSSELVRNRSEFSAPVTRKAPVAAAMPVAKVTPAPETAAPAFTVMIEGDLTVANYDSAAGLIQTDEGMTFVIDSASGDSNANVMQWQDSSVNVHYKCNQSSCTLYRSGLVVPNARRAS